MKREVIAVAGIASEASNLAPMKRIAEKIAAPENVTYIPGARDVNGRLQVLTPSEQTDEINSKILDRPNSDIVLLSMSLGAIAALDSLEQNPGTSLHVIAVAPPLPSPVEVLRHPQLLRRITIANAKIAIESFSLASDAKPTLDLPTSMVSADIPTDYFDEVEAMSAAFEERTRTALLAGQMHIFTPELDWNQGIKIASAGLPNVIEIEGPHALFTDEQTLETNAQTIANTLI